MIPFSAPYITDEVINEINHYLKYPNSFAWKHQANFEKQLAEYLLPQALTGINSVTNGIKLVLHWFGVSRGDEVILPAYSPVEIANMVVQCNAKPVFVDIDDQTMNISLKALERAIGRRTKVIIPCDFAGFPCDYHELHQLVKSPELRRQFTPKTEPQQTLERILILSNASQSLNAEYSNDNISRNTDVAVFSLFPLLLPVSGGAFITLNLPHPFDCDAVANELSRAANHGLDRPKETYIHRGNWYYDIENPGFDMQMHPLTIVAGIKQLPCFQSDIVYRYTAIVEKYLSLFASYQWAKLPLLKTAVKKASNSAFALRIKDIDEHKRNQIVHYLFESGITTNVYYKPIPMYAYYKNRGFNPADYPVANQNFQQEISLPVFYNLSDSQVETIANTLIEAVNANM